MSMVKLNVGTPAGPEPSDPVTYSYHKTSKAKPVDSNKLPHELWISIFEQGQESRTSQTDALLRRTRTPFPIFLTHICRAWRALAIKCPHLWTDIRVNLPGRQQLVRLYLERAKNCLLDFTICAQDTETPTQDDLEQLLFPHVRNCRRITVIIDDVLKMRNLSLLLRDFSAPHLETLEIALMPYGGFVVTEQMQSLIEIPILAGGTPNLRSIRFDKFPSFKYPNFQQLTSFTLNMRNITFPDWSVFARLLRSVSPRLRYLRTSGGLDMPLISPPIELPALEVLESGNHSPIMESIIPANVQRISFFHPNIYPWNSLVNGEFPFLRVLLVSGMNFSGIDPPSWFFETHPLIVSLGFNGCNGEEKILELLGNLGPNGVLLPNLKTLAISSVSHWLVVRAVLGDRIAKGCNSITRLVVCVPQNGIAISKLRGWLGVRNIELRLVTEHVNQPVFDPEGVSWQTELGEFEANFWRVTPAIDSFDW